MKQAVDVMRRAVFAVLVPALITASGPAHAADPAASTNALVFPIITPRVTSEYGTRKHPIYKVWRRHQGVDLAAPMNTHVRAVAPGVVIYSGEFGGYGKLISILHSGERVSMYGHLYEVRINIGDKVTAGQIIGRVGSTGESTGPHLHFEWRVKGQSVDPLMVFPGLDEAAEG